MSVESPEKDADRILQETFSTSYRSGYINVKGFCLPEFYNNFANAIENFKVRDDDIWVCSFPRTGTTWTQEMVWCIANDLDFDGAKVYLATRFPWLESSSQGDNKKRFGASPDSNIPEYLSDSVGFVDKLPSPRFIKCHLPYDLLPLEIREGTKKPKIIYVARNPKDTCISFFHQSKLLTGYHGSFQDFCTLFLAGKLPYAPFWDHILGFWRRRDDENILFLKYEDMITDFSSVIRKTANFLGKSSNGGWANDNATIDSNIEKLMKHLSFESMKSNAAVNKHEVIEMVKKAGLTDSDEAFIRKGEINQWKLEMTQEICKKFDKWTLEALENCDLTL